MSYEHVHENPTDTEDIFPQTLQVTQQPLSPRIVDRRCEHFHFPDNSERNLRALRGTDAEKFEVDFYFAGGDCRLIGNDGRTIMISMLHAATVSPFLAIAFLSPHFCDFESKTVTISAFSSLEIVDVFEMNNWAIYQWIIAKKRASLKSVTIHCAMNMLKVASFFQMVHLIDTLTRHIVDLTDLKSLVQNYQISKGLSADLAFKLWDKIVSNFVHLYANGSYLRLEESEVLTCLIDKRVHLSWQQDYEVVTNYRKMHAKLYQDDYDEDNPESSSKAVPDESFNIPATVSLDAEALRQLEDCQTNFERLSVLTSGALGTHGKARLPQQMIMAQGGWGEAGPTSIVEFYDYHSEQWLQPNPNAVGIVENERAYHGLIASGHGLMVMGGFNGRTYYRTVAVFQKDSMKWSDCCTTVEPRCYVSMGVLDSDSVIACGGYTGQQRLRTAEVYHFEDNQWLKTSSMGTIRSDSCCVSFPERKRVFMIGGFDGRVCHRTMEYYVPERDQWITEKACMSVKRSGVGAVAADNNLLMIMGGFNGVNRLATGEMYDLREGIWHELGNMQTSRSNFGAAVLNGTPFVFGGYNQEKTIKCVESYDLKMGRWREMSSLAVTRSALSACVIDDLELIDKLIGKDFTD